MIKKYNTKFVKINLLTKCELKYCLIISRFSKDFLYNNAKSDFYFFSK